MRLVSFDPFRTLHLPGATYIKPTQYLDHLPLIESADYLLFPQYWQVNALHYALGARLFPSLASYHLGHNKIEMSRAFQTLCPQHIPATEILANTPENQQSVLDRWRLPFVAKTVKSAQGQGVFLIRTRADWQRYCASHEVLYIQQLLPAQRDLRLVVIGRQVIGGYWREHREGGFHNNVSQGGRIIHEPLPEAAVALVQDVANRLDIDHAGFDVMLVDGQPFILEFNRLFGNQGLIEQGLRPSDFILAYLQQLDPDRPRPIDGWRRAG